MKLKEIKFIKKRLPINEIKKKSKEFYNLIKTRRSIRKFDNLKIEDDNFFTIRR